MSTPAQHLVRASDPLSSVMAAEAAAKFAPNQCARILDALRRFGPASAAELQRRLGLTVVQIDRRLPDLREAGQARVVQVGGKDLMREKCRVWEAV